MKNDVYAHALVEFRQLFGSPQELASGTGARFVTTAKGRATIYHQDVAAGNGAELAFEVESLAKRMKETPNRVREFIGQLKTLTGRDVDPNAQHNWPRVGFATLEQVVQVRSALAEKLGANKR